MDSDLHVSVSNAKLNPKLAKYMDIAHGEFEYGWNIDVPKPEINPQRIALVPLTLKDGTEIPAGARIAWAGYHHANDPSVVDKPEEFDPLRSYRKRYTDQGVNLNRFIAGQPNSSSLSFGYGNQAACPGRYFAVGEIKMTLMRPLLEFEFKFPEGHSRPKTMYADENVFMGPHARLMMRKRNKSLGC
ncbi:hypothetical protein C2857_006437 [Epichloe festucae Fl1]|uniref:Cytochrome P450 n=1 Tax=Epichloe festucae (strain Fl1) TaxID=877507 RepID=A0A7S9KLK5_EPIFF|nr:hypothetical protein C2857_006437 [Epichloe festucae Fl1]